MTSEVHDRKRKSNSAAKSAERPEFINYSLTKDDKARFKAWISSADFAPWDLLDKLTESGYSISTKYDDYGDCYAAYIGCVSKDNPNSGYILTGRASGSAMAVFSVLYRHLVIFEQDWPTDTVRKSSLDDD